MEAVCWITASSNDPHDIGKAILEARFVLVARKSSSSSSSPSSFKVPPLLIDRNDPIAVGLAERAECSKKRRLQEAKSSLFVEPPTAEELRTVHQFFTSSRSLPPSSPSSSSSSFGSDVSIDAFESLETTVDPDPINTDRYVCVHPLFLVCLM